MEKDKGSAGFTIIEILVALAVSSVLLFFIYEIFGGQHRLQVDEHQKLTLQQDGRAALNLIANGLRLAGYAPKGADGTAALNGVSVSAGLTSAGINALTYTCDLNENGRIDANETVTYRLNSDDPSILERQVGTTTEIMLSHVAAFAVLYAWDNEGKGSSNGYGDLEPEGTSINWGYDSDGNGSLDQYYVADSQGVLALAPPLPTSVSLKKVRGARLWLLLESERDRLLDGAQDLSFAVPFSGEGAKNGALDLSTLDSGKAHRLFTTTVKLRNMYF